MGIFNRLERTSLRLKLASILVIPLLGLLWFASVELNGSKTAVDLGTKVIEVSNFAVRSSALIHELQKERGATAGFIGSRGQKFARTLSQQRLETDQRIAELRTFLVDFDVHVYGTEFQDKLTGATDDLAKLSSMRDQVSSLAVTAPQAVSFFTKINTEILELINDASQLASSATVARAASAYSSFLQSKERAGLERALLSKVFAANQISEGELQRFIGLLAEQETYLTVFRTLATPEQIAKVDQAMDKNGAVRRVQSIRDVVLSKASQGDFGIDSEQWFAVKTTKIDLLKDIEDQLSGDLQSLTKAEMQSATALMYTFMIITAVVFIVAIGTCTVFIWLILRQIGADPAELQALVDTIARGELATDVQTHKAPVTGTLLSLYHMREKLVGVMQSIQNNVGTVELGMTQMQSGNNNLAERTEQQAAAVEQVASTMRQMNENLKSTASKSQTADNLTEDAQAEASRGVQAVKDVSQAMLDIQGSSAKIAEFTSVIDDVALQTNLLAINAAVEAAHAGEQGLGFAVVAAEVRDLSARSAQAAQQIKSLVEDSQNLVDSGIKMAEVSEKNLQIIERSISDASDLVSEVTRFTLDQSVSVDEVTEAMANMDEVTQKNADMVTSAASQSAKITGEADKLRREVGYFVLPEKSALVG